MRFYKLNGVWQSWDYLHNELGYAEHETRPTVFKSCADATWGEDAGNGYYDGDVNDMINGTFWTDADPTGWFDLDGLVWNSETYPADAAPSLLVKDGVASDALVITCDDGNYYLIRAIIDTTAWIPESEVEALGWRSPSFVVVDSTTGKVVSGCNQELTTYELPSVILNGEDGYETYELPSVSLPTPNVVIGVPMSGPVQAFWFTDNGRNETSDKTFTVVGNPLFDEDGSVARNELYDGAVPLSFMQHDGNMFEADSDSDIARYLPVTDRLVLSIPGDSTTRGKSAWSVQVAKLFVLSYANTQLPDVQIELPINEVGQYGTQITLPTIDGEYESGGKTWKPSAWDIGAFGSSYSLTGDVVAHLVFTEVQQYQEITLYFNATLYPQINITSSFTGNVDSSKVYDLYLDQACTQLWDGYDYSNDYELGYYSSSTGNWVKRISSVSEMPSTTTSSGYKFGYVLLDTSKLWVISNNTDVTGVGTSKLIVRIYPKGQQQYPLYFALNSNIYNNYSTSGGTSNVMQHCSGNISYGWMPWSNSFPERTIVNALYSSGKSGVSINRLSFNGTDEMRIGLASGYAPSFRNVIFTLDVPTYTSWANLSGNKSAESKEVCPLFDKDGEYVVYDPSMNYTIIGLFNYSGGHPFSSPNRFMFDAQLGAFDTGNPTRLCFKLNRAVTFSYVWYIKTPIS